jgi:hypothetical protein
LLSEQLLVLIKPEEGFLRLVCCFKSWLSPFGMPLSWLSPFGMPLSWLSPSGMPLSLPFVAPVSALSMPALNDTSQQISLFFLYFFFYNTERLGRIIEELFLFTVICFI